MSIIRQSLAVKYRPKHFDEVAGQKSAVARLQGIVKSRKIPAAFLFAGPSGCGKTTLASMLAAYLNCDKGTACGECKNCTVATHPDVRYLNAADARGIDEIRGLIREARFKPQLGKYRIIICDEAQQITPQGQQALLTTLETPPANTIFVICSMEPDKLHQAIVNRCSVIPIERVTPDQVADRLRLIAKQEAARFITKEAAQQIAEAAGGQVRTAVSYLEAVIQYVEGAESDATDIKTVLGEAIADVLNLTDDEVATKALLSLYVGNQKTLHSAFLDASDFVSLLNKMTFMNMYVMDSLLAPQNSKVIHSVGNRDFVSLAKTKCKFWGSTSTVIQAALLIQAAINETKLTLGTFMANDRATFATKFGLAVNQVKKLAAKTE